MQRSGVVGVGLGLKKVNGLLTDIPAVKVFVTHKRPRAELSDSETVPPTLSGSQGEAPTDVEEMDPMTAPVHSSLAQLGKDVTDLRGRHRPVFGGLSASHFQFDIERLPSP